MLFHHGDTESTEGHGGFLYFGSGAKKTPWPSVAPRVSVVK